MLVGEFGPRMGAWYLAARPGPRLRRGRRRAVGGRGHSRETTYQQNLTTPEQVEAAVRELRAQVFDDTVREGRPVFRVGLKVRYAPFFTQTKAKKLPGPDHRSRGVVGAAVDLADRLDPAREVRLLGVRAEMVMPEEGDPAERTPIRGRL